MKLECNTVKKCLLSISQVKGYQTINHKAIRDTTSPNITQVGK